MPKYTNKSVAKDSIRAGMCSFSFTVMRKLNQGCFRIIKSTNLRTKEEERKNTKSNTTISLGFNCSINFQQLLQPFLWEWLLWFTKSIWNFQCNLTYCLIQSKILQFTYLNIFNSTKFLEVLIQFSNIVQLTRDLLQFQSVSELPWKILLTFGWISMINRGWDLGSTLLRYSRDLRLLRWLILGHCRGVLV